MSRIARALVLANLLWLVLGGGCGSASKATGEDGGAGAQQGAAGAGGATGGAAEPGAGGHAGGGTGGGGKGGAGGKGGSVGTSLPACPGVAPTPAAEACRTSADCPQTFATCDATYHSAGCGACIPPLGQCSGDGGCRADQVCVPASNPCNCNFAGGPGTMCIARCTATSCGAFESCDTASGLCVPKMCGPDLACASGRVCAPTRTGADVNGCAVASCSTDGYTCPAGTACTPGAGADVNGCSPISCVGGAFKCPRNTDCKAGSTSPHSCERRACTSDTSCDCGACVQGSCQDRLFICSPPPAA